LTPLYIVWILKSKRMDAAKIIPKFAGITLYQVYVLLFLMVACVKSRHEHGKSNMRY